MPDGSVYWPTSYQGQIWQTAAIYMPAPKKKMLPSEL